MSQPDTARSDEKQIAQDLQLAHEIQAHEELEYEVTLHHQHQLTDGGDYEPTQNPTPNNSTRYETPHSRKTTVWLVLLLGALIVSVVAVVLAKIFGQEDELESQKPTKAPGSAPAPSPTPKPPVFNDYFVGTFPGTVLLRSNDYLIPNQFVACPSGKYRAGMNKEGDLVLEDSQFNKTVWSAGVVNGARAYMQDDGNLVIRNARGATLWSAGSHEHEGSMLIVDDGGRIGVRWMEILIWMQGVPQGIYKGPSSHDLTFPVRGAFYYSWYPKTWTVSTGDLARFEPDVGYYVSGDPRVVDSHIDQLDYGKVDVGIISWWGPGTNLDIARITQIMDRTLELNATVKWTIYYEDEWKLDPSPSRIQADLEYIKKWFAWHPAYAHVDGKPLIYIWNEDDCEVVERWMNASKGEWHVIPKLFGGFRDCPIQPAAWHQYGPASEYQEFEGDSVSISPGFWHAGESAARLPRLSHERWCQNVQRMVDSGEPWQLITTFNEAGEGTGIETTSKYWPSESGYGYYLDCLHNIA